MKQIILTAAIALAVGLGLGLIVGSSLNPLDAAMRKAQDLQRRDIDSKKDALELLDQQREFIELAISKIKLDEARKIIALAIGVEAVKHQMWNEAIKYLTVVQDMLPTDYTTHYNLAVAYANLYNVEGSLTNKARLYDTTLKVLNIALTARPDSADANYLMGMMLYYTKDYAAAMGRFQNVLQKYPKDIEALLGVARIYYDTGDLEKAQKIYFSLESMMSKNHPKFGLVQKNLETISRSMKND